MNKLIIALSILAGLISTLSQAATLTLTQPLSRAVFQRNPENIAMVPIAGTYTGSPSKIEARSIVMSGFNGTPTDWQVIVLAPAGGSFSAVLPVTAGGWYRIEVRPYENDTPDTSFSVERIGVGEVFIAAGQSNSANHGSPTKTPAYDTVSTWTGTAWRQAYDPQPAASGSGGSPWSRLTDMLASTLDVPIGFISVGVGGTAVLRWVPSSNDLYPRIRNAITAAGPNGMRAILWHQGESDAQTNPTPAQTYADRLTALIKQSRVDAGWQVPWGVALAAWMPTNQQESGRLGVRQGQLYVIHSVSDVFQGPDTDIWTGNAYRHDTIHFNALGLQLHAAGWMQAILNYMYPWDLNQDRTVGLADFSILSANWFKQYEPDSGWWKFDETSGTSAEDSSVNNSPGTLKNGPLWTSGMMYGALHFDGVDDYIEIASYAGILGTQSRTCSAWIKSTNTVLDIVASWGTPASGQQWNFGILAGKLTIHTGGAYIQGSSIISDGQWHYIAAVLDSDGSPTVNEIKLYVDGQPQTATTVGSAETINTAGSDPAYIGCYKSTSSLAGFFTGDIDDVRVYSTGLSNSQIAEAFEPVGDFDQNHLLDAADIPIFSRQWLQQYKAMAAHWTFDESTGITSGDSSGNGHNGVLINGPDWTTGVIGGAVSFDGVDDYIEVPNYKGIIGTLNCTCSAWIKTSGSTSNMVIIEWGTGIAGQQWLLGIFDTGEPAVYSAGPYIKAKTNLSDNQWHHVAAVRIDDGTSAFDELKLYIDGQFQTNTFYAFNQEFNIIPAGNVHIGAILSSGQPLAVFNGLIDDVRIDDIALSNEEITALFQSRENQPKTCFTQTD